MPSLLRNTILFLIAFLLIPHSARAQCPGNLSTPDLRVPGLNATKVTAMVEWDSDGPGPLPPRLLVSGDFTQAGSTAAAGMAVWDGAHWEAFLTPVANAGALIVFNGELIAATPNYNTSHPTPDALIRWDGTTWLPMGQGLLGTVYALASFNGQLYAGGQAIVTRPIARWNGTSWQQVTPGGPQAGTVYALQEFGGKLFAGGTGFNFPQITGAYCNQVAAWTGTSWTRFPLPGPWPTCNCGTTRCFAVYDNKLYAGNVGNDPTTVYDGISWQPGSVFLFNYSQTPPTIHSMLTFGGDLYAAGDFIMNQSGHESNNLIRLHNNTWSLIAPYGGFGGPILSLASFQNHLIIGAAGGNSSHGPPNSPRGLTAWDGTSCSALTSDLDGNAATAAQTPWGLFFGGPFNTIHATLLNGGGLFDGATWTPLGAGPGLACGSSVVHNGQLFIGGYDYYSPFFPVRRWDGSTWQTMGAANSIGAFSVNNLASYNNNLIATFSTTMIDGVPANNIARWDGSWHALAGGLNSQPAALLVHNTHLIAGGYFDSSGSTNALRVASWDGNIWSPMSDGFDNYVTSLAEYRGEIIAGGRFLHSGTTPVNHIARWDGAAWQPLAEGFPGFVQSLAPYDNRLFALGQLTTAPYTWMLREWDGQSWSAPVTIPPTWQYPRLFPLADRLLILETSGYFAADFVQTCGPICGTADFDGDSDTGTDADIAAFFACLSGSCCPTCGSADFNADGDSGTDADIESFFRILAGGPC